MVLEAGVAAAVVLAGVLHATWNTLVKTGGDRTAMLILVMAGSALPWLPAAILLPPPAPASWPFIAASIIIHLAYFALLLAAYRHGDLSQVYPIARGAAPALVAAGGWAFAGEALSAGELAGVAIVSAGILSLAWRRGSVAGGGMSSDRRGIGFALLTALSIGAYIVVDGMGVRRAGPAFAYVAWLFILQGLVMGAIGLWLRRERLAATLRDNAARGLIGGVLSSISYGVAIWAMSLGAMAHVAALRETSVLVAAVIGTRLLGEPFGRRRVIAALVVAGGAVLLQAGGAG